MLKVLNIGWNTNDFDVVYSIRDIGDHTFFLYVLSTPIFWKQKENIKC